MPVQQTQTEKEIHNNTASYITKPIKLQNKTTEILVMVKTAGIL